MGKNHFIITVLLSLLIGLVNAASTQRTLIREDNSKLVYYLNYSFENTKNLLILLQGSDCNSVFYNDKINAEFSNILDNKDVLTIEKYGINKDLKWDDDTERTDCPQTYLEHDSPSQRISDIKQILDHVLQAKPYSRVIVLGGSEGALIANILSASTPKITHTIALNGGGRWFIDDVLHNIKQTTPKEAYESEKQSFIGFSQHVLTPPVLALNVSGHGYAWWRDMLSLDQTEFLSKTVNPTLIIQSGKDVNVSPELALKQAQLLMKLNDNITYKSYEGLDHGFIQTDGSSQSGLIVNDIKVWLSQTIL